MEEWGELLSECFVSHFNIKSLLVIKIWLLLHRQSLLQLVLGQEDFVCCVTKPKSDQHKAVRSCFLGGTTIFITTSSD